MLGSIKGPQTLQLCLVLLSAVSCMGTISDPGATPGTDPGGGNSGGGGIGGNGGNGMVSSALCRAAGTADPGPPISRRLTRTEYNNTVLALLRDTSAPALAFPGEELSRNFDNNPQLLSVSNVLAQGYFDAAEALATSAVAGNLTTLVGACAATGGSACAQQFIRDFGARAFRRPVSDEEVTRLTGAFTVGAQTDFKSGIRLVITAMLQSAPFLYRLESGGAAAGAYLRPTSYEMASRLSYLLWKSMPDPALFTAAQSDQLQTPEQIRAQAVRMIADARTQDMVLDFHGQWLDLRSVPSLAKDPDVFPAFTDTVATGLRTEAEQLIKDVLFTGSGDVTALFTAPYTYVNADLARFYGAPAVSGTAFQKVTLDGGKRAGILTLGGVMAVAAKSNRTSAVLRGAYVRQQLLCEDLPSPPPNIPALPDISPTATARERLAQHEVTGCAECHKMMDPIGIAFEGFDAVGRYRANDEAGVAIDPSGQVQPLATSAGTTDPALTGTFTSPADLGAKLAASDQPKACMVTNWFRYANGRLETDADACPLYALGQSFKGGNYTLQSLLLALTQTDAFLYRRQNGQ